MKTKVLIYFSALLFLSSCSKDKEILDYKGQFTLSGLVVDASTGKGVPYARIRVIETTRGFSGTAKYVVQLEADANGNYSFSFQANAEDCYYRMYAKADDYMDHMYGDEITFTRNGKKTQNISLVPYAYYTLRVVGNSGGHKVNFSYETFYGGVDTTILMSRYPLSESPLTYWVYFIDTALNYKKTITIHPAISTDTPFYKIEF